MYGRFMGSANSKVVISLIHNAFALAIVAACSMFVAYGTIRMGIPMGAIIACLPLALLFALKVLRNPRLGLIAMFLINYFVIVIIRYTQTDGISVVMDILAILTLTSIVINTILRHNIDYSELKNGLTISAIIWLVFCCMELANPSAMVSAWVLSRGLTYYFLIFTTLTFLLFNNYKDIKTVLYILSVLTLLGILKGIIQQVWGFDSAELRFLNDDGGARTHILLSGTRYFSFYASAGIFGAVMGHAFVVFGIAAFYMEKFWIKVYFIAISIGAFYAMIISGTRGAIAVPIVGFILFIILSKKIKIIIPTTIVIVVAYVFLAMTSIGQGNQYIRRMRTIFDPNEPSLMVRKANQARLGEYLKNKPIGEGLGLSGVDAKDISVRFTTSIPTDSWYVKIWVETGIIGLCLHIGILLYIIIYGSYLIFSQIKDKILKGLLTALLCGITGILAASYGNQVLGQFPVMLIIYMSMAFVFMAKRFDKQIADSKLIDAKE